MSRYKRTYTRIAQPEAVISQVGMYLNQNGYQYKEYGGEMVFHKGNGWLVPPKCFKISFWGDTITVEGWLKFALLPYVAVGEMDFSENLLFIGIVPRSQMQRDAKRIENIIMGGSASASYQYNNTSSFYGYNANVPPVNNSYTPPVQNYNAQPPRNDFKMQNNYGSSAYNMNNAGNQGSYYGANSYGGVSKKDFINYYADKKYIKEINSCAIVGYVGCGLSLVLQILLAGFLEVSIAGIFLVIIELAAMIGLILGMHIGKSSWCAYIWLGLQIMSSLISLITDGRLYGVVPLCAAIYAVKAFTSIDKEYQAFKLSGSNQNKCKKCGANLNAGAYFCPNCGEFVNS